MTEHNSWAFGKEVIVTGGVVRFYSSGPAIYENSAHACTGITNVWIHPSGALVLDNTYTLPVVAAIAQADETLVRRGITAGISGGIADSHVMFYHAPSNTPLDLNRADHYKLVAGTYSNIWYLNVQVKA